MNTMTSDILKILQTKMTTKDEGFLLNLITYKLGQIATNMGTTVTYIGGKKIPTNIYVLNLANSGFSKGKSLKFLETEIFHKFKDNFSTGTFIDKTRLEVEARADLNAILTGKEPKFEEQVLWKKITDLPSYVYTFGSGSTPEGLKGLMTSLSMRRTGAISLEIDEIGSNISSNKEVLDTALEVYDNGLVKNKLKRTDSNAEIENPVAMNLMAFGTPSRLFDGGPSEEQLMSFLETGYGRRFLFGYVDEQTSVMEASEKMLSLMDKSVDADAERIADELKLLSDIRRHSMEIELEDDANVLLFEYEEKCLKQAGLLKAYQDIEITEMSHRYFRVLKISGIYGFIEGSKTVTKRMVEDAIELVERSGEAFKKTMQRDKPYVRLAKYIAEQGAAPVTLADLTHDLGGFFKGSESAKRDMLTLAKSWAATNDIIIKESLTGDIQYFTGEVVQNTSLDNIIVSASTDLASGYVPHNAKWTDFTKLCTRDMNFCTHHFEDQHRTGTKAILDTNLLVLDIDEGVSLKLAQKLLEDYEYLMYTTKRHTETHNRFRVLIPMSKIIKLTEEEHTNFYKNIYDWLPFEVDDQTADIARKWQTYKESKVFTNEGKMFDPTIHIPNTTKAIKTREHLKSFGNDVSKLERYIFANVKGRNNGLLQLAAVHVDRGLDYDTVDQLICASNAKLADPLSDKEIAATVMKTVSKKIHERDGA